MQETPDLTLERALNKFGVDVFLAILAISESSKLIQFWLMQNLHVDMVNLAATLNQNQPNVVFTILDTGTTLKQTLTWYYSFEFLIFAGSIRNKLILKQNLFKAHSSGISLIQFYTDIDKPFFVVQFMLAQTGLPFLGHQVQSI